MTVIPLIVRGSLWDRDFDNARFRVERLERRTGQVEIRSLFGGGELQRIGLASFRDSYSPARGVRGAREPVSLTPAGSLSCAPRTPVSFELPPDDVA